mmetsp:Transcript_16283/g.54928  ORF Transcript_16283/g.54928 Transcript_16283/m.54928 type:complete len:331 (+) Transcript_16283:273-1265(+)
MVPFAVAPSSIVCGETPLARSVLSWTVEPTRWRSALLGDFSRNQALSRSPNAPMSQSPPRPYAKMASPQPTSPRTCAYASGTARTLRRVRLCSAGATRYHLGLAQRTICGPDRKERVSTTYSACSPSIFSLFKWAASARFSTSRRAAPVWNVAARKSVASLDGGLEGGLTLSFLPPTSQIPSSMSLRRSASDRSSGVGPGLKGTRTLFFPCAYSKDRFRNQTTALRKGARSSPPSTKSSRSEAPCRAAATASAAMRADRAASGAQARSTCGGIKIRSHSAPAPAHSALPWPSPTQKTADAWSVKAPVGRPRSESGMSYVCKSMKCCTSGW